MSEPRDIIEEVLAHYEQGRPEAEILGAFRDPFAKAEAEAALRTIASLTRGKEAFSPRKEVLQAVLSRLPRVPVTNSEVMRYNENRGVEKEKGRPSIASVISQTHEEIMKWKIWVPVAVVAVLLIVFFAANRGGAPYTPPTGGNQTGNTVSTGNPSLDGVLNGLVSVGGSGDENLNDVPPTDFDAALDDLNSISI